MVAADITEVKSVTGNLGMEIVKLELSNGETYLSKFGTVLGAWANSESRAEAYCSVSGSTVTVNCTSASDDVVHLFVVGY